MTLLNNKKKSTKNMSETLKKVSKVNVSKFTEQKKNIKTNVKIPKVDLDTENEISKNKLKQSSTADNFTLPAFSLLTVDEDQVLYADLPNALKKILYTFIILAILSLGIWYLTSNQLYKVLAQATEEQNKILELEKEKLKYNTNSSNIKFIFNYYQLLDELLKHHITWLKFFQFLERFTVPEVYYTTFSVIASQNSSVKFSAVAQNLKSALQQYKLLKEYAGDYCSNVEISNIHFLSNAENENEQLVGFDIAFTLNKNIFFLDK